MDTAILTLNKDWRFHLGECEESWYKGYDDSSWRDVMIPHDWSVEAPFSKDYSSGTGYLMGGIGWYRVSFALPEEYCGKRIRVVFDGVYKNSQVWCNSYYLGKRPSGYTSFSYDISDFAVFGERKNTICVRVVHTDLSDSRWFTGSGITRKVSLVIEEPVHPAQYGCFFMTKEIVYGEEQPLKAEYAVIQVEQEVMNTQTEPVEVAIKTQLLDENKEVCVCLEGNISLEAGENGKVILEGKIKNPCLWSPEHPYLYQMRTWYQTEKNGFYLVHDDKTGIRSISFQPKEGFFLNGINTKIKGVCVHHDGGCLGAAMRIEVWQRRLELLRECGCNAIRCSHNPHMPELYELCDAMGFLMMDEAFDEWENPKNKWSVGHNVYPPRHQGYYEDFPEWHERDLRAMVRRDRNHPSVILWSIGNEIDYPNDPYCHPMFTSMTGNNDASKPEKERQYDVDKPNMERISHLASHLASIVKKEDKSRPVTLAAAFPELSSKLGFFDALDVVGYNYKEHLYEQDHERFPSKTFLGSENGHSLEAWQAVTRNPYICGQFLWTGIDYLGEAHGWPVHGSPAGILTSAGFVKPDYYRRRTFWKNEPLIWMATGNENECNLDYVPMSFCWNYEQGAKVLIKCYAGLFEKEDGNYVVLCCNDQEIERGFEREKDGAYWFHAIFEQGCLEAKYYRKDGELIAKCHLTSTERASELSCQLWKGNNRLKEQEWSICSSESGYLYQVLVTLTDDKGQEVVWDDKEIKVQVQGDGELAGMDNGNLADVTPFTSNVRKTEKGKLAVYVRRTGKGGITVLLELQSNPSKGKRIFKVIDI